MFGCVLSWWMVIDIRCLGYYYIIIIHILLYIILYYYILYIIILYYTLLFFCSLLPYPSFSFFHLSYLPISPPNLSHSFYTCRYLHILIYIPSQSTIRPRTFYRSGWLRRVGLKYIGNPGLCFELVDGYCV